VEIKGTLVDLHNNFRFSGYEFDELEKSFVMKFEKGLGEWIPPAEFGRVTFIHKKTSFLNITWTSENEFPEDAITISEITFYPSIERDENDNFLERHSPNSTDDIVYSYVSGAIIRVCCEDIALET